MPDSIGMLVDLFQLTAARRRLVAHQRHMRRASVSFNSQPPEGGWAFECIKWRPYGEFQLTAARRRLETALAYAE